MSPIVFQSPSRRGVNYFLDRAVLKRQRPIVSVPFAKGRQLLLAKWWVPELEVLRFSPLREGASITSRTVDLRVEILHRFSPLREGATITSGEAVLTAWK